MNLFYKCKNFVTNLPLFLKLAWQWKPWDSHYTIMLLTIFLKRHAQYIKKNRRFIGYMSVYKRGMTASGMLDRAYNRELDKTMRRIIELQYGSPLSFKKTTTYLEREDYFDSIYKIARDRQEKNEKQAKKEAWLYLNKYIEQLWD